MRCLATDYVLYKPTTDIQMFTLSYHYWYDNHLSDRITTGRNAIFGHVARLPDNIPAHQAMQRQVELSVGQPQNPTRKRPPGRPRTKWTDQLCRDNNVPTATLWRQAIGRGHSKAKLLRINDNDRYLHSQKCAILNMTDWWTNYNCSPHCWETQEGTPTSGSAVQTECSVQTTVGRCDCVGNAQSEHRTTPPLVHCQTTNQILITTVR